MKDPSWHNHIIRLVHRVHDLGTGSGKVILKSSRAALFPVQRPKGALIGDRVVWIIRRSVGFQFHE